MDGLQNIGALDKIDDGEENKSIESLRSDLVSEGSPASIKVKKR